MAGEEQTAEASLTASGGATSAERRWPCTCERARTHMAFDPLAGGYHYCFADTTSATSTGLNRQVR